MLNADAVLIAKWHHIGNEAERTEADGIEQELAQFGRDFVAGAESLCDGPREFERDTRAGQPAEGIVAGQARVNDCRGVWDVVEHFVVIGDDQIQSDSQCFFGFRDRGDAAIDGNHQRDAARFRLLNRFDIQAISFVEAVRHVEVGFATELFDQPNENGGAGHAVRVVVAEHADEIAVADRVRDAIDGGIHARQAVRRVQPCEWRFEEPQCLGGVGHVAVQQQLRDDSRHADLCRQPADRIVLMGQQVPLLRDSSHG